MARLRAFPEAEGFGAYARGGRGGDVYHVTQLLDDGPGSLRHGVRTASGPRTIVFDVPGTIDLESPLILDVPYLTVAGQTAPGGGITLRGYGTIIQDTHDVIVRYLRFRPGDMNAGPARGEGFQSDALWVRDASNVIIDHVSASWGIDETLSLTREVDQITVQWSIISESLRDSYHAKGPHGYGSIIATAGLRLDFANNVIYDWGMRAGYSGDDGAGVLMNYVGNYLVAGPSTAPSVSATAFLVSSPGPRIHQAGNLIDSDRNGIRQGRAAGWIMFDGEPTPQGVRFAFPTLHLDDALTAYHRVLAEAGASRFRDAVDVRIVNDVSRESGALIDSQSQVGGWPELPFAPPPRDGDRDGMPDAWERSAGLDPEDPLDRNGDRNGDGYTNLEEYLNESHPLILAAPDPALR
jgi:hypothetical protein